MGESMEEISMIRKVTKNGISLKNPKLRKYINQKVMITVIINPIIDNRVSDADKLLEVAGLFDEETAKIFEEALDECRQIDYNDWK
jgi:hypothetical protein